MEVNLDTLIGGKFSNVFEREIFRGVKKEFRSDIGESEDRNRVRSWSGSPDTSRIDFP